MIERVVEVGLPVDETLLTGCAMIQVSDTGRDDDWHDVGSPIERTGNYINRFDLQSERPKALYVRVLRPGVPEVFHANGIYVFGEPAA